MKIKEFKEGSVGTVEGIITSVEEKTTRNNTLYVSVGFSDGETDLLLKKWNESLETFAYQPGQVVLVSLKADSYNGSLDFIIREITESSADPDNFIISAPVNSEKMYDFLLKTAEKCGVYAPIVTKILTTYKKKLLTWGAGKTMHHNIRGGLLYHIYRMTKLAGYVGKIYNQTPSMLPGCRDINTELLVAGVILHDIGKLFELDTNNFGNSDYTINGRMLGHAYMGAELVSYFAKKVEGISQEDQMLLKHMILSHHGLIEYGAVVEPMIPEAMVLHYLDMIDSKLYQFESVTFGLEPGTISNYQNGFVFRPSWRVFEEPK